MRRVEVHIGWLRALTLLLCIAVVAGCGGNAGQNITGSEAGVPGRTLKGYLPNEAIPDSVSFLPPPPGPGSPALAFDEATARESFLLRGSPRWRLAQDDADLSFAGASAAFSCALDTAMAEQDVPRLRDVLTRILADVGRTGYAAKERYRRDRPFLVNKEPICTPDQEKRLTRSGSYPSSHAGIGWAWALILTEIAPDRTDALLARGRSFGHSRVVCNVHWLSDIREGRMVGAAVTARLHGDPAFREDLKAAGVELAALRAKRLKPVKDCSAEAATLAVDRVMR